MAKHLHTVVPSLRRMLDPLRSGQSDAQLLNSFVSGEDQGAFEAVVRRHGPRVLEVCRRIVGEAGADDAFQVAFLTLARNARSLQKRESVGAWLCQVAKHVALYACERAQRRRQVEETMRKSSEISTSRTAESRELVAVIEAELAELPEKYRAALLLCGVEGKTHRQASRILGVPVGSISRRVERGREMLRHRLARRGYALTSAAIVTNFAAGAQAAVPAALLRTTVRHATAVVLARTIGQATAQLPVQVAELFKNTVPTMLSAKNKLWILILIVTLFGAATGVSLAVVGGGHADDPKRSEPPASGPVAQAGSGEPLASSQKLEETPGEASSDDGPPRGARARLGSGRFVHSSRVFMLTFSPDSKKLASCGDDGFVRIWDAATRRELRCINPLEPGNPERAFVNPNGCSAEFAPDGKTLAVGTAGKPVLLYDTDSGKLIRQVKDAVVGDSSSIRFTPDSKQFVCLNGDVRDRTVRLFDAATGKEVRRFEGHESNVQCAAFSGDGKCLVTGSEDQTVRLWDVENGKERRILEGHHAGVLGVAITADGRYVASVSSDLTVRIWDGADGKALHTIAGVGVTLLLGFGANGILHFSPDGKTLTACADNGIYKWETATGKELRRPHEVNSDVRYDFGHRELNWSEVRYRFAISPDEKYVARYIDGQLGRIEALDGTCEAELLAGEHISATAMAVSPDSKLLATGGDDRIIRIWDMKTAKEVRKIEGATATINFLEFLPDGKSVISASWHSSDRVVTIWDVTSGKERRRIRMGASRLWWLRMSSDGRTMACVYFDALSDLTLHFLDPNTHKDIRKVSGGESYACNFALSPDGKKYIFQSMSERRGVGTMVIGDVAEDKDTTTLLHGILGIPVFAPDSLNVAVMGNDGIIHVLDTVTGNEIRQFGEKSETEVDGRPGTRMLGRPFEPGQTTLAYSADGRMLASLGKEGLLLWEVATGKQRRAFAGGHHGALSCLTFTPDGTTLLSSSQEGQVFFWDLAGMSKDEKDAAEKLTSKDAEKLWNDLQAEDAARAYRAIRLLSAAPGVSLPLFEEKLKPAAGADQKRIDKLIADLDAEEFDVRARAVQELEKLDELAVTSLRKALEGKTSVEAGKRIEEMLQKIGRKSFINGEKLRTWRALEVLEHMNGEAATSLLKRLASGAEGAWLTREAKASLERSKAARNQ